MNHEKKFKTQAEKKALRFGIFLGMSKNKENTKPKKSKVTLKNKSPQKKKSYSKDEIALASAYANHMGAKFSLSDAEVSKNIKAHLKEQREDKDFYAFLVNEYGAYRDN